MIKSYKDYKEYLLCDRIALFGKDFNKVGMIIPRYGSYTYKYLITLRKLEYITNVLNHPMFRLLRYIYRVKLSKLSVKTGITLPPNTFGKGLGLYHYGSIVVNGTARFGDWCVIQSGVNISSGVVGGDFVYLAPGSKVNENIKIASHVIVGSNAVLTKDASEESCTYGGVPAKKYQIKAIELQWG